MAKNGIVILVSVSKSKTFRLLDIFYDYIIFISAVYFEMNKTEIFNRNSQNKVLKPR